MKKVKIKFKPWIVILAAILLLSTLFGLIMQIRGFTLLFDSSDTFGGQTLLLEDFNKPSAKNNVNGVNTALDYGLATMKTANFTEGNGSFTLTVPANTSGRTDGIGSDNILKLNAFNLSTNDFSVITMDFDVDIISDSGARILFNFDVREGTVGRNNVNSRIAYENGVFKLEALNGDVFTYEGKKAHFTYVINHEKTLIYIDGKLFSETGRMYDDGNGGEKLFQAFIMNVNNCTDKSVDLLVSIDNVVINKFAPDYDGAINKLFKNPDKPLKKNSDTIFGGAFVWPEE